MVSFTVRKSALDTEKTYSLTGDSLTVRAANGVAHSVPLSDVTAIELDYRGEARFTCVIRTESRTFVVSNLHYVSLGRYESRSAGYRQFVLALHRALRSHADQIRFTTVNRTSSFRGIAAAAVLPLAGVLAMAAVACTEGVRTSIVAGLALCPAGLATTATRNRGRYTTDEVPHLYLP